MAGTARAAHTAATPHAPLLGSMATSGLGTARWKVMSPLVPESGSVALMVRMALPAGVCSGNVTWEGRKPLSALGPPGLEQPQG